MDKKILEDLFKESLKKYLKTMLIFFFKNSYKDYLEALENSLKVFFEEHLEKCQGIDFGTLSAGIIEIIFGRIPEEAFSGIFVKESLKKGLNVLCGGIS